MKKLIFILVASFLILGVSQVEAQTTTTCKNCGGTGVAAVCSMCGGSGAVYTMFGPAPCPGCMGMGRIPCSLCSGRGYIVWQNPSSTNSSSSHSNSNYGNSSSSSSSSSSRSSSSSSSRSDLCLECYGDGKCPQCKGTGYRTDNMFGTGVDYEHKCSVCNGGKKCWKCGGSGRVSK